MSSKTYKDFENTIEKGLAYPDLHFGFFYRKMISKSIDQGDQDIVYGYWKDLENTFNRFLGLHVENENISKFRYSRFRKVARIFLKDPKTNKKHVFWQNHLDWKKPNYRFKTVSYKLYYKNLQKNKDIYMRLLSYKITVYRKEYGKVKQSTIKLDDQCITINNI